MNLNTILGVIGVILISFYIILGMRIHELRKKIKKDEAYLETLSEKTDQTLEETYRVLKEKSREITDNCGKE